MIEPEAYRDQYRTHLERFTAFLEPLPWDNTGLTAQTRGNQVVFHRPDGEKFQLHLLQFAGVVRVCGKELLKDKSQGVHHEL